MSGVPVKRILAVGNCAKDQGLLAQAVRARFSATLDAAATIAEGLNRMQAQPYDLVLVNRVFHASDEQGLDFIRRVQADAGLAAVPVMLLSNYPEYQQAAVAAGARPGFGKSELGSPRFAACLEGCLE